MEYIPGVGLDQILLEQKRLQPYELIEIFSQICKGLAHVHSKGLVHRDLKPGNVMVAREEFGDLLVKIVDFGIAKEQSTAQSVTQTGEILGSPLYMSPEQANAAKVDARSDIYSVGCMLYEAATGRPPFQCEGALQTLVMRLNNDPPPFEEVAPFACLSGELEAVVRRALQREPDARYQTMAALCADLRELVRIHPAPTEMAESIKTLRVNAPIVESVLPKEPVRWKSIAVQAAAVVLMAAGLLTLAWYFLQEQKKAVRLAPPPTVAVSQPAPKASIVRASSTSPDSAAPAAATREQSNSVPDGDAATQEVLQQSAAIAEVPAPIRQQWKGIDDLIKAQRHFEAAEGCKKLISDLNTQGFQLNPFTAEVHCAAGVEAAELKDIPTAQSHLSAAVQIFSAHKMYEREGRTLIALAQLEYMMKRFEKAHDDLAKADRLLRPTNPGRADQARAAMQQIESQMQTQ
jgi:serine/threonine protein kinase